MKNPFSINSICQKLILMLKRFPISLLLLVCFVFLCSHFFNFIINTSLSYDKLSNDEYPYVILFVFFSVGSVIGVVAVLWLENFVNYIKQHIITAAIVLLWGIYCFFMKAEVSDYPIAKAIEFIGIIIFVFLSFFFISFLKKDNNNAFWNFSVKMIFHFFLAIFLGSIIFEGLSEAISIIVLLFGIDIDTEIASYASIKVHLVIFICILFVPIYFLANIPNKIAKQSEEIHFAFNKYSKIFALYILAPIAAIYAIILYVYLIKIIIALELPKGLVSYLVSALVCYGLFIISLLHPSRIEEKNKFIAFVSRYFGLIILPLLALMSIGIIRRINDYGITILRLYILLINIWFYGICIYLFITKAKKIKPIFISFAVVALLSSINFIGIPSITKHVLTAQINWALGSQKISSQYDDFFKNIEPENRKKIKDKIVYLYDTYDKESIIQFFIDSNAIENLDRFKRLDFSKEEKEKEREIEKKREMERIMKREKIEMAKEDEWERENNLYEEWLRKIEDVQNKNEDIGKAFMIEEMLNKNVQHIENFNTIVPLSLYNGYNASDNIIYYSKDNEFIIKVFDKINYSYEGNVEVLTAEYRNFSLPIKELGQNIMKMKLPLQEYKFYQGKDYTILINSIYGNYYKSTDQTIIVKFDGFLFYNK